ncbi:OmpH family outer membrane protein [Paracoccus methylarcula]|uniref:OmpH family outer membrane protein n=1 Tax=Paracoccus methylarcula TaxID=72022 RepID=A0A422QUV6_9RHOB|nr:OmpH family outer membrane protein [Paracoccus methylarcula]RNF33764.1 OmpH family outer membrane protein [Paracoccus methylarcula]
MPRLLRMIAAVWLACACLIAGSAVSAQELTDDLAPTEPPSAEQLPNRTIETGGEIPQDMGAPVLTVDQEQLFAGSAWGQRAKAELEEEGGKIEAENERLAQQLSDEEAELTRKRETTDPAEFRKLAEAFDARATEIRRERAQIVQELSARNDAERNNFFQAALPIMGEVMQRRGAVVVLDRRTVFVSLSAIDITEELIAELDKRIGEGPAAATGDEVPEQGDSGD